MKKSKDDQLTSYGSNLSDFAHTYKEEFFRTREIRELTVHIKNGNNVLLVGKEGCGIDFIIRGVVKEAAVNAAASFDIYQLTLNDFLIDIAFVGQLETRLKGIIDYFKGRTKKAVIFFPEIHYSIGAGTTIHDPHGDLASRLSFCLDQKEIQIIGSTTPDCLRRIRRENLSFLSNFAVMEMSEMPEDNTIKIVQDYIRVYKSSLKNAFDEKIIKTIIRKSSKLFPLKSQPGAAIDLLSKLLFHLPDSGTINIKKAVASTISGITEIREDFFNEDVRISTQDVINELNGIYVGQEDAVRQVASVLIRMRANLSPCDRPSGVMFFVGPTGVGKTELAKCISQYLLGDKRRLKIYDMSEYSHHESIFSLIGHPGTSTYSSSKAGRLVDDALTGPYSIFLLDEIEKCHKNVVYLLLQVLGEGRLKDSRGDSADFCNSIIIMTSNVGFSSPRQSTNREDVLSALENTFPPEFINRIEHIMFFDYLTDVEKKGIAEKELREAFNREGIKSRGIELEYGNDVIDILVRKGFSEKYNARGIQRAIEDFVVYPLSDLLSSGQINGGKISISVDSGRMKFRGISP